MEEIKTKSGLVGFYDIMGYQSFLENNDAEIATSEVLRIISGISSRVNQHISSILDALIDDADKKNFSSQIKEYVGKIQWLVFSDTILMLLECGSSDTFSHLIFVFAAGALCRQMFDFGLPVRGAIKRGKYLITESCFAGRTIVEAYRTETSLNLAACAVERQIYQDIKGSTKDTENLAILNKMLVEYLTPLKNEQHEKMILLNFLPIQSPKMSRLDTDVRQMVLNSFWAHNKDMEPSAQIKAKNTENFFRFLKHKMPDVFK
jgi:hypothetical protein